MKRRGGKGKGSAAGGSEAAALHQAPGSSFPPGPWQLWEEDKESREADIKPSLRVIVDLLREGVLGSLER